MEPVLSIEHLSFSIGGQNILNDISLAVTEGEWFSIIGPNGAGKTTLFRCLIRIYQGKGSILLGRRPIARVPQRELARHISYVPQQTDSAIPFTVEEYVLMGRYPHLSLFTTFRGEDRQAVREALTLTGISHLAHRRLWTLSGGERQTAVIAAALVQGGRIMLLDEPSAFLDPRHARDVHAIIRKINRERGITILMVTHDINSAALHSDRIGVMKAGRFLHQGRPDAVMSNEVLEPVYGTSFTLQPHPDTGIPVIVPEAAR
ncbi:ABC transporter ATP-binding protein [Candidatus Latescibacterota bacterium]